MHIDTHIAIADPPEPPHREDYALRHAITQFVSTGLVDYTKDVEPVEELPEDLHRDRIRGNIPALVSSPEAVALYRVDCNVKPGDELFPGTKTIRPVFDQPLEAFIEDGSVTIQCADSAEAVALTNSLYESHPSETFEVTHRPITNDDSGAVEAVNLFIQRLTYDTDEGWFGSDPSSEPDFEYTGILECPQ